ncbi:hypothetical protein [Comamonas koreensis]|uniref:Tail fiber protein n=1 Tax=Comamonas koreensis TaxID=160825 RepID=A0AAW4XVF1_9BURK|nr:hypothetical protein [Comamonas koreensis]MCD2164646.1 hypothetical protein [Comamonas koreensis]
MATSLQNPAYVPPTRPAPTPMMSRPVFVTTAFNYTADQEPFRVGMNNLSSNVYSNAVYTFEQGQLAIAARNAAAGHADAAAAKAAEVDRAAADVRAALDAIEAGPVASVMGRTGVVTGLVETAIGATRNKSQLMANAPIGQWVAYSDTTGSGADWPPGHPTVNWWNVLTYGTSIAVGRVTQRASQALDTGYQGWIFERQLHDTTWGPWQRILTSRTLIESGRHLGAAAPSYTVDPSIATVNWVEVFNAVTINVPNPRGFGDQLTILISMVNASPITFSSNVKLPVGGVPALSANTITTMALIARVDGVWNLHIGGANPW